MCTRLEILVDEYTGFGARLSIEPLLKQGMEVSLDPVGHWTGSRIAKEDIVFVGHIYLSQSDNRTCTGKNMWLHPTWLRELVADPSPTTLVEEPTNRDRLTFTGILPPWAD